MFFKIKFCSNFLLLLWATILCLVMIYHCCKQEEFSPNLIEKSVYFHAAFLFPVFWFVVVVCLGFFFLTDCKTKNLLNHFGLCFAWKNCWPGKKFLLLIQWNIFYISLLLCTVVLHYLVTILGSKLLWKFSHHIVWMPVIGLSLVYIPLYFRGEELLLKHVWLCKVCCGNYRNHRVFFCLFHFSS